MEQRSSGGRARRKRRGNLCRPPIASPEPGRMIAFPPFQGFIWGMSAQPDRAAASLMSGSCVRRGDVTQLVKDVRTRKGPVFRVKVMVEKLEFEDGAHLKDRFRQALL